MARAFRNRGFETVTLDLHQEADIQKDILELQAKNLPGPFDVIWASPPCTTFSVCTISRHFVDGYPVSVEAFQGLQLVLKTIQLIHELKPRYFFIENPRGMLRSFPFMRRFIRRTATYCQYGDTRQKPTDIWTNNPHWHPRPICGPGDACHEASPRGSSGGTQGSSGGTQGLANAYERGKIPMELCREIAEACENSMEKRAVIQQQIKQ